MASADLAKKLNDLLNGELAAHNTYLQMAAWACGRNLEGAKAFFLGHSAEERVHMLKFLDYLDDIGAPISINAQPSPDINETDIRAVLERFQAEEQAVSRNIFAVIDMARSEHDYATDQFLQWFAQEQHEEEKLARAVLDKHDLIGDGPNSAYLFDLELARLAD